MDATRCLTGGGELFSCPNHVLLRFLFLVFSCSVAVDVHAVHVSSLIYFYAEYNNSIIVCQLVIRTSAIGQTLPLL